MRGGPGLVQATLASRETKPERQYSCRHTRPDRATLVFVAQSSSNLDDAVLFDPYHGKKAEPPKKPPFSPASIVATLLALLPVGSVAAIFFGLAGLRQTRLGTMRGRGLAIGALVMSGLLTVGYAVAGTVVVMQQLESQRLVAVREEGRWADKQREREAEEAARKASEAEKLKTATPLLPPGFLDPSSPQGAVPKATRVVMVGRVPVVDLGVDEPSLAGAFTRESEAAKGEGKEVMIMLGRSGCAPCDGMMRSLEDPLMQDALSGTRLVRVDIQVFQGDLMKLSYPTSRIPGFFLMRADAMPRDGIDGGEWGDDIATNIAPVLKPFTRGTFKKRKREWRPLPMSGTFL